MRTTAMLALCATLALAPAASAADLQAPLQTLLAVSKESTDAATAWKQVVKAGPSALPEILGAFDQADVRAANWLRTAFETIADQELAAGRALPAEELEKFVKDTKHAGVGRRLAYEWLVRVDPKAPERLLPTMLEDPGAEMRRDAVAVVIEQGKGLLDKGNDAGALAALRRAFAAARDRDQVDELVPLLKKLGEVVDLPKHFGVVQQWLIATSFDNVDGVGFAVPYPPEKGVDLNAVLKGKEDAPVRWAELTTADPYGMLDLNDKIGKKKGVVAYALAVVESPKEQPVQIRAGSNNAIKLFLNGKELFSREEYHHGVHFDQHVGNGVLKAGRNEILVKICQNQQTEKWAQDWAFQVRVCDAIGGAVPLKFLSEKPKASETPAP